MKNLPWILVAAFAAVPVQAQPNPQVTLAGLASQNPDIRRAAISKFVDELDSRGIQEYGNDLIPVAELAISDSDEEVRRQGFGALNLLSQVAHISRRSGGKPVMGRKVNLSFEKFKKLKLSVRKGFLESNPEIRGFAINTLGFGYQPARDTEDALVSQWSNESNNRLKRLILGSLAAGGYSSKGTKQVVIAGLEERNSGIRARAAQVAGELKIKEALPSLIAGLKAESGAVKGDFIDAVAAFGTAASSFESEILALESKEKDPEMKARMKNAAKAVRKSQKD